MNFLNFSIRPNFNKLRWALSLCQIFLPATVYGEFFSVDLFPSTIKPIHGGSKSHFIAFESLSDISLNDSPKLFDTCVLLHGYVVSEARLTNLLEAKDSSLELSLFTKAYFGSGLLEKLQKSYCKNVVLLMQESILTTPLQMTERTEQFLKHLGCSEQKSCLVYGHSKGGLVATTLARRCMEERSLLGPSGCAGIKKFYSAAGNNVGAVYGFTILGMYLDDPQSPQLQEIERSTQKTGIDVKLTGKDAMVYKAGQNNPIWVDITPLSPMESGVPLGQANLVALDQKGWLTGTYGASNSGHDWSTYPKRGEGCGPWRDFLARVICGLTGPLMNSVHTTDQKYYFALAIQTIRQDARFLSPITGDYQYLDTSTWNRAQTGDGLADLDGSLGPCRLGGTAVRQCKVLNTMNHAGTAGSNQEMQSAFFEFLTLD